jgi:predicted HD superfamily hydrolase involved in NAD metabolism
MDEQIHAIEKELKKELTKERFEHTRGVMYTAACLAMRYGCDMRKAMLAGLLHDCAKHIPNEKKLKLCKKNHIELTQAELDNPSLIHAKLGAFLAKNQYDIEDSDILHAIRVHTTGAPEMNLLDKIIFLADYIEPNRNKAKNLSIIRELAFQDIDKAILQNLSDTLRYLDENKEKGSIDPMTLQTYEYYKQEADNDK